MPAIPSTRANFAPSMSLSALPAFEGCAEAAADHNGLTPLDHVLTLAKDRLVEVDIGLDHASVRSSLPIIRPIDIGLKTVSTTFWKHLSYSLLRLSLFVEFCRLASTGLETRGYSSRDDFIVVIRAAPEY